VLIPGTSSATSLFFFLLDEEAVVSSARLSRSLAFGELACSSACSQHSVSSFPVFYFGRLVMPWLVKIHKLGTESRKKDLPNQTCKRNAKKNRTTELNLL